ncbi:MAG: hypothetical protein WDZ74_01340 [Candidatus Paceibacterota bacterium]
MKIRDSLPQFDNNPVLIIVTGQEHAEFYRAHKGEIELFEKIESTKSRNVDTPEKFETRTSGMVVSGADEEKTKEEVREFFKNFEERIPDILKKTHTKTFYLFSPAHVSKEVVSRFPRAHLGGIAARFDGNYSDKHLFDLLTMIQTKSHGSGVGPKSGEAQKLYKKFSDNES